MNTYQEFLLKQHEIREIKDFRSLVYGSAVQFGEKPAFILRERHISYNEFMQDYRGLCTKLLKMGYRGKKIGIVGANSYGWILSYLAASTVGVAVPVDKELSSEDIMNFLIAAECAMVLSDDVNMEKINASENMEIYSIDIISRKYNKTIFDLAWDGNREYDNGYAEIDFMETEPEALHVLIFTSGTTGNAKGVCLSQKNICSNIMSIASMVKVDSSRHALSLLPLHHTYESTIGHLLLLYAGGSISYCDGLRYVGKNMSEYSPSVIIAVPLLLEYMLRTIEKTIKSSLPKIYKKAGDLSFAEMMQTLPGIVRSVIQKKVRKSLGGKLNLLIVGAAAIKPETIDAFDLLGIKVYQGYGLTECAPLLAGNNDFFRNNNSVGLPIHGVDIKIENPDSEGVGEIAAKGDNIMLGYYKDEEATEAVIRDGYFHTGDLGKIDEDGYLYITGRIKNVIVTRNGKNIYPEELESRLMEHDLVEEAIVIGAQSVIKDDITAKARIFPSFDCFKEHYKGVLPEKEAICKEIKAIVEKINDNIPSYKRITAVEVVWEPFEKTTTKKIKRFGANIA